MVMPMAVYLVNWERNTRICSGDQLEVHGNRGITCGNAQCTSAAPPSKPNVPNTVIQSVEKGKSEVVEVEREIMCVCVWVCVCMREREQHR